MTDSDIIRHAALTHYAPVGMFGPGSSEIDDWLDGDVRFKCYDALCMNEDFSKLSNVEKRTFLLMVAASLEPDMPCIKPFRTGDVVRYIGQSSSRQVGAIHIVRSVNITSNGPFGYKYSTNLGAWYYHSDFELVRECDVESLHELWEGKRAEQLVDDGDYDTYEEALKHVEPWVNALEDLYDEDDEDDDEDISAGWTE